MTPPMEKISAPSASDLLGELRGIGIHVTERDGKLVLRGPRENLTPKFVATLKLCKVQLLAALQSVVKAKRPGWQQDERGRLVFPDGTIYSPTPAGGWILTKQRARSMVRPGTFAPAEVTL